MSQKPLLPGYRLADATVIPASRNRLETCAYLGDALSRFAAGESNLAQVPPDRWRAAHPDSACIYRDAEREARRGQTRKLRALGCKKCGK